MAKQTLRLNNFSGGLSDDDKYGAPNSFSQGPGIDFRSSPGVLTLQKEMYADSQDQPSIVTTEIRDIVRANYLGGALYFAGGTKLYRRGPGTINPWVAFANAFTNLTDFDYRPDLNSLFLYDQDVIHEMANVSLSQSITMNKYKWGRYDQIAAPSNYDGVSAMVAYTLPTSATIANSRSFVATADPLDTITVYSTSPGTVNLTMTILDGAGNVIATKSALGSSFSGSVVWFMAFQFATPVRLKIGTTYYVTVTQASGTGTSLLTYPGATADLTRLQMSIDYRLLVNTGKNGHRTIQMNAKTYICNDNYLAQWEILSTSASSSGGGGVAGFDPHRLKFPSAYKTVGVAIYNEYLVVACSVSNGYDPSAGVNVESEGALFFWDTAGTFYNFMVPVPQGVPNSLTSAGNMLYWEAKGRWYRWGGSDIQTVFEFPGVDDWQAYQTDSPQWEIAIRAGRSCMTIWNGLLLCGFPYQTASLNVLFGVYSFGHNKGNLPDAIGYDYVPSSGQATVQFDTSTSPDTPVTAITALKSFGQVLALATKSWTGSAVQYRVDLTGDPYGYVATASWAALWFDAGSPEKNKSAEAIVITFEPLPMGSTLTPKYRFNREANWRTDASVVAQPGTTIAYLPVPAEASRFREIMVGFDVTNNPATGDAPRVNSVSLRYDDNEEEEYDAA